MSNSAIVIQWGTPYVGREHMGLGVFMAAVQHYSGLKASGAAGDVKIYIPSQGNFTENSGTMIVEGTADQIHAILASSEHRSLLTKAAHVVTNLRVAQADTGERVMQRIEELQAARKELGI